MTIHPDKDPIGNAIMDYMNGIRNENITVSSDISEDDFIPVQYLFRTFSEMPEIEQKALLLCKGRTLDIGAGSGSHSLFLQEKGIDITALDISKLACKCCKIRGIKKVKNKDFFDLSFNEKYDTLLMLMNGIGFTGTLAGLDKFLTYARSLLTSGGQILLDSSDIRYMFEDEDEETQFEIFNSPMAPYYGEIEYIMTYKNIDGEPFKWLFIDPDTLKTIAENQGFKLKLLHKGNNNDFLAQLTIRH
ncbi:MAG: methyltransferase domain-containing protein [Chlorobi bacterium]|nr:methyltransferase domain-containing protein [Chlorobiota bacterium]